MVTAFVPWHGRRATLEMLVWAGAGCVSVRLVLVWRPVERVPKWGDGGKAHEFKSKFHH